MGTWKRGRAQGHCWLWLVGRGTGGWSDRVDDGPFAIHSCSRLCEGYRKAACVLVPGT